MSRRRVAVLISGRGSNLVALVAASKHPDYPAEIVLVISDQPEAVGLGVAEREAIAAVALDRTRLGSKAAFETALNAALEEFEAEIVCLAGFMRLLSGAFVESWHDRLINIHPSLLPAFPGLDTHERALAAGVRIHGATVHFVRAATDHGPIIAQGAVPVLDEDTPETLAARVLAVEHRLYPLALRWVASGAARVVAERVLLDGIAISGDLTLRVPA